MIVKLTQAVSDSRRLTVLGPDEFKYRNGDRRMIVLLSYCVADRSVAIHLSSISKWLPTYEHPMVSEQEGHQIANAIAQAFIRRGRSATLGQIDINAIPRLSQVA